MKLSTLSLRINMHLLRLFASNTCIMHQIAYLSQSQSCRPSFQNLNAEKPCDGGHIDASDMSLSSRSKTRKASHFRKLAQKVFTFNPLLWSWPDKVFNLGLTLLPTQPLLLPPHSPQTHSTSCHLHTRSSRARKEFVFALTLPLSFSLIASTTVQIR